MPEGEDIDGGGEHANLGFSDVHDLGEGQCRPGGPGCDDEASGQEGRFPSRVPLPSLASGEEPGTDRRQQQRAPMVGPKKQGLEKEPQGRESNAAAANSRESNPAASEARGKI